MPGPPEGNLRGQVRTDADGRYEFITVIPGPYTIPLDGPTGKMTAAAGWSPWRPAHIHLIVSAEGYEPLVTQLFIDTSDYLDSDVASAVKPELIVHPEPTRRRRATRSPTTSRSRRRARPRSPRPWPAEGRRSSAAGSVGWSSRSPCASAGSTAEVYEQADELREIGAAVALSANGTRELRRLGLGEQVEAVSVVPSALVIRRGDTGEVIADHPIGRDGTYEATFGAPYYGVHRVALLQALGERLGGEGLHLGRRCVGVEERPSGVELRFADGSSAAADVVVGADGVHSVIRPHVAGPVRGQVLRHGRLPRARAGRGHAVAARSDAAAVLGGPGAAPPALRDRRRADRQLPRRRPRPGVDQRRVDGGVRGQRRGRRLRRLAPRRHRDGRRAPTSARAGRCTTSRRSSAGTPIASS